MSAITNQNDTSLEYSHEKARKIVWGVSLGVLLASLDQTIVAPILPAIGHSLAGEGQLSWIVSAYLLTVTTGTPFAGKLSDIYGRRKVLIVSIAIFAVASALCALSQSVVQLVMARGLQGIGGAGLMTMAHAAIADVVPPRERGRYQIYLSSMWAIGSVGGPVIGGLLVSTLSWQYVFWINIPLAIIALAVCEKALRSLKTANDPHQQTIDYRGAVCLTLVVGNGILILSWAGSVYSWFSATIFMLMLLEAAFVFLLVKIELKASNPFIPLSLFGNITAAGAYAMSFANAFITFGAMLVFPLKFAVFVGSGPYSGALLAPLLLAIAIFTFVGGTIARRMGHLKGILISAFTLILAGTLGTVLLNTQEMILWSMLPMTLIGCGVGLAQPAVTLAVQSSTVRRDMGVASSTMLLMRSVGGAFGASVCGSVLFGDHGVASAPSGADAALLLCSLLAAAALLIAAVSRQIQLSH